MIDENSNLRLLIYSSKLYGVKITTAFYNNELGFLRLFLNYRMKDRINLKFELSEFSFPIIKCYFFHPFTNFVQL